jgi:hypothetical protein
VEKGPIILLAVALVTLAAGIVRFINRGHFTATQAGYCMLSVLAALLLVMLADYTLHHARLVLVLVLAIVVLWLVASPSFCVGLGLALTGIVIVQSRR